MRTVLAYLIAPGVAAIIATLLFGPSWDILLAACVVSYPISWALGTVAFLILKKQKKEEKKFYAIAGAIFGGLLPFAFSIGHKLGIEIVFVSLAYAFLGSLVAMTFILIRGPQKVHPDDVVNSEAAPLRD